MTKISVVVALDIAAAVKELARVEDRSVGAVVRLALAAHVGRPAATEDGTAAMPPTADGKDGDGR